MLRSIDRHSPRPSPHDRPCRRPVVENPKDLVEIWGEFIDWDGRREGEDCFLVRQLQQHDCHKVFDSTLGDGCDTIYLRKEGFEVWSNEIDPDFERKARENAAKKHIPLEPPPLTHADWRNLDREPTLKAYSFDATICLGNSLTYLFDRRDQLIALEQFRRLLRPGGILIIDERNYQYWLADKDRILREHEVRYKHRYVYIAEKVEAYPVFIDPAEVVIEYSHRDGRWGRLHLYPFKRGEMKELLERAGFEQIEQFSDYNAEYTELADFYHYVCVTPG